MPSAPSLGVRSQHAMLVHTIDLDGESDVRVREKRESNYSLSSRTTEEPWDTLVAIWLGED